MRATMILMLLNRRQSADREIGNCAMKWERNHHIFYFLEMVVERFPLLKTFFMGCRVWG